MQSLRATIRKVGVGLALTAAVFLGFALYAYLAPATYRTHATVTVEFAKNQQPLPAPEAQRRLEQALLDVATLHELAHEMDAAKGAQRTDDELRRAAEVSSGDGRTFELAFSDRDASRAQRMAGALARRAVLQVPRVFGAPAQPGLDPALSADRPRARVLVDAPLPDSPIRPNRARVLTIGALLALATGVAYWLFAAARSKRDAPPKSVRSGAPKSARATRSSTPPKPDQAEQRILSNIPTLIGTEQASPLELAVASYATERARATDSAVELPPPTPKVLPELARALEAWRSSSKMPVAETHQDFGTSARPQHSGESGFNGEGETQAPDKLRPQPTLHAGEEPNPTTQRLEGWRNESAPPPAADSRAIKETLLAASSGNLSDAPPSRPRRRRAGSGGTLMMGSFTAPDAHEREAPRSIRPAPVSETTYRYSSAPPPPPEPKREKPPVNLIRTATGWLPDPTLILPLHKTLREQLYAFAVERCFTIVVTGLPDTLQAKSRVAAGLALALADTEHPRILLVDANFHHPCVHRLMHLELPVAAGFSQQLHSRIHGAQGRDWDIVGCSRNLHVLAEGVMRSPGMILSKQFERSLRDLQKYYDVIVIDGPDTSFEFDCRALDSLADGVALVCRDADSPEVQHAQALFSDKRFSTVIVAQASGAAKQSA